MRKGGAKGGVRPAPLGDRPKRGVATPRYGPFPLGGRQRPRFRPIVEGNYDVGGINLALRWGKGRGGGPPLGDRLKRDVAAPRSLRSGHRPALCLALRESPRNRQTNSKLDFGQQYREIATPGGKSGYSAILGDSRRGGVAVRLRGSSKIAEEQIDDRRGMRLPA